MKKRFQHWSRVGTIISLLTLTLFKFQNCAKAPYPSVTQMADGGVQLVDQYAPSKVQFLSDAYLVQVPVQNISVQGLCVGSAKGQMLDWELVDSATQAVIEVGQSECVLGNFLLQLSGITSANCSKDLELRAKKADKEEVPAVTLLRPLCDT